MIGVDVGATKVFVGKVDGKKIETSVTEPVEKEAIAKQIIRMIKKIGQPTSIGVGIAGQVNKGTILFSPNLDLHNYPLQELLNKEFNVPVNIQNDVQAAGWGEFCFGAGQNCQTIMAIFLGTGIGGCLIANGRLMTGSSGEIGHMVIREGGLQCSCGRRGCLEPYAGGWGLAKRTFSLSAKEVFESHNPELLNEILQDGFDALVTAVSNLVNLFNPEKIIIGGGLLQGYQKAFPDFFDKLLKGVKEEALKSATEKLIITPAELEHSGVIGSAHFNQNH